MGRRKDNLQESSVLELSEEWKTGSLVLSELCLACNPGRVGEKKEVDDPCIPLIVRQPKDSSFSGASYSVFLDAITYGSR